ncbi:MAG: hypothetical protein ACYSWQ_12385 [Planctomycetota bacterium]|jgi:hypothetical protein
MSRAEKRNVAIVVVVGGVLLAGGALLANYSGILRADTQEQPKVGCGGEGKVCTGSVAATEAAGFPTVYASVDEAPGEGCCSAEKPAGCGQMGAGCGDKVGGCCGEKPVGCCEVPPAGCCGMPKGPGCCPPKAEGADS